MRHICVALTALLVITAASARPFTCIVHPTDEKADFKSLQEALYGCGAGNTEIELIIGGTLIEGTIVVAPHLTYLVITSNASNIELPDSPTIIGAFNVEHSPDLWLEISHVILDGGDYLPSLFHQKKMGPVITLAGFGMHGCIARRYTGTPVVNVLLPNSRVSNNQADTNQKVDKHPINLDKAMSFPWSLNRAAAYAKAPEEGKN